MTAKAATQLKQLALAPAIASLGYVFWIVGCMEMVERLAFYGVKTVATLYAKDPVSKGGLGVSMTSFGNILMTWALVQSILPVFTGGLSDRYGYKQTIFVSTILKICGYLLMAWFPSYYGFLAGAVVLAAGTAVFKPGIQGTLVRTTNSQNSAIAWGIFYQTVNIGGFLGPLVAGMMRQMAWHNVFYACAVIICLNFLLLLTYQEPIGPKDAELRRSKESLWRIGLKELKQTHVWLYLAVFAGFWFMFFALFDVLPAHIEDWIDTSTIVQTLVGPEGTTNPVLRFFVVMNKEGTQIMPEGLLNLNAALIMITCFLVAHFSGRLRPLNSMVVGTLLASFAFMLAGYFAHAWLLVIAIALFSLGEMMSSPKFTQYMGNIAPDDKKAMYLGFSQMSLAIGWTLEGKIGPSLYEHFASKDRFARELLLERGMPALDVDKIPQGEAFDQLLRFTGESANQLTTLLYNTHNVGVVWYIMATVGALSALGIYGYSRYMQKQIRSLSCRG